MLVLRFCGVVQGVGFRPLVYKCATSLGLKGAVYNENGDVIVLLKHICTQALIAPEPNNNPNNNTINKNAIWVRFIPYIITAPIMLDALILRFLSMLCSNLPHIARITTITIYPFKHTMPSIANSLEEGFCILPSMTHSIIDAIPSHLHTSSLASSQSLPLAFPADSATCNECLRDIMDDASRFYHYHLCACTHCGARWSIIHKLPYDRERTSMRDIRLCKECASDIKTPFSRFYHAQPISCNHCAIPLHLFHSTPQESTLLASNYEALKRCASLLHEGHILCIKGLGGFALICDSRNTKAIAQLRIGKQRPHKPFAIMCSSIQQARTLAHLSPQEEQALLSPSAPIVLAHAKSPSPIAQELIAPGITSLGILLANTPLHHLLLQLFSHPIIYTSANLSHEPIITHKKDAFKLAHITPYILDIEREIIHGIDDGIMRLIDSAMRPLRLGRGLTPTSITLPLASSHPMLALGSEEKITPALLYQPPSKQHSSIIITPYIGDLQSPSALERLEQNLAPFLAHITPKAIISDTHPRYHSTQYATHYAQKHHISTSRILHHHAHFYAIYAESSAKDMLGIIWDGSGLGDDGSIWGGEFLYKSMDSTLQRVGHFAPFILLGGEKAITEISRIAYMLCILSKHTAMIKHIESKLHPSLHTLAQNALANPARHIRTSSIGRIIDAIAYMLGLVDQVSYEGQAGVMLESLAYTHLAQHTSTKTHTFPRVKPYPYTIEQGIIKWQDMIYHICDEILQLDATHKTAHKHIARIAYTFFYTLADMATQFAISFIKHHANDIHIGLSGGVFQNKLLCEILATQLRKNSIPYHFHMRVPCNDGGIAFGQLCASIHA